jgi:ornithine cyclodeaminase/alanine dehydrogenase-like protein (mu-crystallin family)
LTVRDQVLAAERAYVAVATASRLRARAVAGAVASRYLAVGTPHSFALIGDDPAIACSLDAHRTWFAPRDVRCTSAEVAATIPGARVVTLAEALASDIVCVHVSIALAASQLRRGTHVNALADLTLDADLRAIATIVDDTRGLPALAAGLVDGRQLDEITIFVAGDALVAASALGA